MLTNYTDAMKNWQGRVDSTTDYDAFRWHQWVKPIDLNQDTLDVTEGKLKFCFIGFCSELGVERNKGRIGTALGPDFTRKAMSGLPCAFSKEVALYDAGDIHLDHITLEEGQKLLGNAVAKIMELGMFPIVLGGGHETTLGHYKGEMTHAWKKAGVNKPDMAIVSFDAHFDMRPYENGGSSGSMFLQIADYCKKEGLKYGYMPIGIQRHSNTVSLFKKAQELGVDYLLAKDIQEGSLATALERVDNFLYKHESAYITVCTDVFSTAFAPGVSAPQALGLDPKDVVPIMKHVLRTRKVRGFDICEISPRFDQDSSTAKLGAVLIFMLVTTMAELWDLEY
ncbi:MAG: formimidoylglutamase [Lachnospiraceae bacterium]|nr:formimidoylglutamase [Lachnospiraceae bacterium]